VLLVPQTIHRRQRLFANSASRTLFWKLTLMLASPRVRSIATPGSHPRL